MNHGKQDETRRGSGPAQLADDQRHVLLAVERRRTTLEALEDVNGPVDLYDLAAAVAAGEADEPEVDDDTVQRVALSLHHAHLPKMAQLGVVEYDAESTRIRTHP